MSAVKYKEVIVAMIKGDKFQTDKGTVFSFEDGIFISKNGRETYSSMPFPMTKSQLETLIKLDNLKEFKVGDIRELRNEKFLVTFSNKDEFHILGTNGETTIVPKGFISSENKLISRNESFINAIPEFQKYMEAEDAPR